MIVFCVLFGMGRICRSKAGDAKRSPSVDRGSVRIPVSGHERKIQLSPEEGFLAGLLGITKKLLQKSAPS